MSVEPPHVSQRVLKRCRRLFGAPQKGPKRPSNDPIFRTVLYHLLTNSIVNCSKSTGRNGFKFEQQTLLKDSIAQNVLGPLRATLGLGPKMHFKTAFANFSETSGHNATKLELYIYLNVHIAQKLFGVW